MAECEACAGLRTLSNEEVQFLLKPLDPGALYWTCTWCGGEGRTTLVRKVAQEPPADIILREVFEKEAYDKILEGRHNTP